jgi:hypothetical protein
VSILRLEQLRSTPDPCPTAVMDLWSTGLAVYRRAHMPRCSLWEPVRLPEVANWLVRAVSSMSVRKLAADREAAEDDLLCHRLSGETAGPWQPTP